MQKSFVVLFIFSIIVITSTVSNASATSGWVQSVHPPNVRHTAVNPGNIKICGNHICAPFENFSKLSKLTQNHESYFVSQNTYHTTKMTSQTTSATSIKQ